MIKRILYENVYNDNKYMKNSLKWLSIPKRDGSSPKEDLEYTLNYSGIYPYTKKHDVCGFYPTPHELVRLRWLK